MNDLEKQKVLDFFNENDNLDILDPDGICSFIRFTSAETKTPENENMYYRFDLTLDPNSEEFEDVFILEPEQSKILDADNNLSDTFQDEFYNKFIQWMRDMYYA